MDAVATAHALVKLAAGRALAKGVGKAIATTGDVAKYLYQGSGSVGAGLAEGLGSGKGGQHAGELIGKGLAFGAGVKGVQHGKRKLDEARYRRLLRKQQAQQGY